jgi:hypothetical protein
MEGIIKAGGPPLADEKLAECVEVAIQQADALRRLIETA